MTSLTTFLVTRIEQLENRLMMIPRYLERPGSFVGRKDFSLEDLPKIQLEIEEAKVALAAVLKFKKDGIRSHACQCKPTERHGETQVICCNDCGLSIEEFWNKH